jgi:hypothetical protein
VTDASDPRGSSAAGIPALFHFVWYGESLPDFAQIAVLSALERNPDARAILWHADLQGENQIFSHPRLELRLIDVRELLNSEPPGGARYDSARLLGIYQRLRAPAARSNLVRLLVLERWGGIYLDTDTITLKDFTPLRGQAFCGLEYVLFPAGRPLWDPRALLLGEVRRLLAAVPHGYRFQAHLLGHYRLAANNAVLGVPAGHRSVAEMLSRAAQLPEDQWLRRYRLGTHLLQQQLAAQEQERDATARMVALGPEYFYPQGPIISRHYLRDYRDIARVAGALIPAATYAVHWYASVSDLWSRDRGYVRAHRDREVFSHLCAPYAERSTGAQS